MIETKYLSSFAEPQLLKERHSSIVVVGLVIRDVYSQSLFSVCACAMHKLRTIRPLLCLSKRQLNRQGKLAKKYAGMLYNFFFARHKLERNKKVLRSGLCKLEKKNSRIVNPDRGQYVRGLGRSHSTAPAIFIYRTGCNAKLRYFTLSISSSSMMLMLMLMLTH